MPVIVRRATPADGAPMARVYAPSIEATPASFEERAPTAAEMAARVADGWAFAPWLVAERDGAFAGYAYAAPHRTRGAYRWACETSIFVDDAHHRAGVASALYTKLFALLRLQGFVQAYAGIVVPNDASVGLHEALGFELVGVYRNIGVRHDAWRHVGWWGLELVAPPLPPPVRRAPHELEHDAAWRALLPP